MTHLAINQLVYNKNKLLYQSHCTTDCKVPVNRVITSPHLTFQICNHSLQLLLYKLDFFKVKLKHPVDRLFLFFCQLSNIPHVINIDLFWLYQNMKLNQFITVIHPNCKYPRTYSSAQLRGLAG